MCVHGLRGGDVPASDGTAVRVAWRAAGDSGRRGRGEAGCDGAGLGGVNWVCRGGPGPGAGVNGRVTSRRAGYECVCGYNLGVQW